VYGVLEIDMGIIIEETEVKGDLQATLFKGVTCIFCGLPTPVDSHAPEKAEAGWPQSSTRVSLVRCEICRKEAPYLSREVTEFGDIVRTSESFFRARPHGLK
jgi:hypothetical protein